MAKLAGLIARPDGSLKPGRISFDSKIERIEDGGRRSGDYIVPGFIDLQVNGSHGIDVMSAPAERIREIGARILAEGTTAFLPTAVTSPIEQIEAVHEQIRLAMADGRGSSAEILGMHLEGPFISPKRLGAHRPLNLEPRGKEFERVLKLEALRLVTIAPEVNGALDAIKRLRQRGVAVSLGHTDASFDEARAGVLAGARMFTHLFNAMRPLHHREPGVAAVALVETEAFAALIADGVHVHPEMLRLALRARGARGIVLTPDRVALSGVTDGARVMAGREHAAISDGAARLEDGTLAGGITTMLDGLRTMVRSCGAAVGEAALMASTNPASVLELKDRGRIEAGCRADIVVLDRNLDLKAVFVGGREAG